MKQVLIILCVIFLTACSSNNAIDTPGGKEKTENSIKNIKLNFINKAGTTVGERIKVPNGCERVAVAKGSFGEYLRNLPLKPDGSKVRYYNGRIKPRDVYAAVIDIDVGDRDLQQCADAVIRFRAEYLYGKGLFDKIHFDFTNGFKAEYSKWRKLPVTSFLL